MKVLYSLLALLCIVSTACSDKSLGNFNGPVHGGTFNQESQKTDITANLNHGSFTGGTFIGKRAEESGSDSSEVVDNKKKDKRLNIISGSMSGVFNGGNFNGKRQNIISGDMSGVFNGGNFNGKRDNKQGTNSSEVVDNKKKDKRPNIISGSVSGVFNGGNFNGKRQNIISGDLSGTFNAPNFSAKRNTRGLNLISGSMSGTFNRGNFNGKRDSKLPPILPDDFQGIINTDTFSVFTSSVPVTEENSFPHSYTFVTPSGKKFNIRSKNELKTKADRRNALVQVEKARRSSLKKGEAALDTASSKVEKLTQELNGKFSKFMKF
jgi:hypothetical protein